MSAAGSVAEVADPGLATGPLGPLLQHGRTQLEAVLDRSTVSVAPPVRPYALSLLAERSAPLLVVTPRTSDAEDVVDGLRAFLGHDRVALFPAWETLPHERLSPEPATVGRRLAVLDRLVRPAAHPEPLLAVVTPVRAALQPMDPALADRAPIDLDLRWHGFDDLVDRLAGLGYSRATQVEVRGEFAVRGGLVDVFPTAADHAVRIEFFGDDVEEMRTFSVADQRSIEGVEQVRVDPARELVLDEGLRERAARLAERRPGLRDPLEDLAEGIVFEGAESLVTLLHRDPALLPDFLPADGGLALLDPMMARDRAGTIREEAALLLDVGWDIDGSGGGDAGFARVDELFDHVPGGSWELTPFDDGAAVPGTAWESWRGDLDAIGERLRDLLSDDHRVVVTTAGRGPARRVAEVLREQSVPATVTDALGPRGPGGRVEVVASPLRRGFTAAELDLSLVGEWDLFGARRRGRAGRRIGNRRSAEETVLDLSEGDHVVHRTHGVGIYRGMVTREVSAQRGGTATRDYVVLEYAEEDRLYVPADQIDALARYRGGETPAVMTLGGSQWERAKSRVRDAVRDVAGELIRLYAARMHAPGRAFAPDGAWQRELEDTFAHRETEDQLTVVDEIKRDMEAPVPMDRVLAGDVGFGKTEVAVRAAAKAVFDGSQVAVLVPTTVLAQQHHETFRERLMGFPVEIRMLSRFVSQRERDDVRDGLAAGTVDLVVGTHALLSEDVEWDDLGLLIVDEEQRFGVTQKEQLKQLRTSVDVLSMSATPIPRTLEMAVSGIRDLSVIETPPEDRQPIRTVVQDHDESQIALAIRRELLRDGQVFYVHNQVDSIHDVAEHLGELVDDARIAIAHGQMEERRLEEVMIRFWEKDIDVLVCTTIIESGLDIPNANTLIVERADLLGLAQLHQLRGRVGRSSQRAYAYFLYPEDRSITEAAYKRLETLSEHTRLGAGLSIAMRDLQLRGAGNVVGAEQSGHVAAVGFDMYTQLLKEEIAELTGEPVEDTTEVRVDQPVDAHPPSDYDPEERQRLQLYKKVSAIRDAAGVRRVTDELRDRFGPLPEPARRMLTVAALKAAARRWGIEEISLTGDGRLRAAPVHLADSRQVRLQRVHPDVTYRAGPAELRIPLPDRWPDDVVGWAASRLREVLTPQDGDGA